MRSTNLCTRDLNGKDACGGTYIQTRIFDPEDTHLNICAQMAQRNCEITDRYDTATKLITIFHGNKATQKFVKRKIVSNVLNSHENVRNKRHNHHLCGP